MSLPYFPLYPSDFEADTSHLTIEEDGVYNRLLRLMWMAPGCSLPDDDAWLARRLRLDQETFERAAVPVLDEFFKRAKGRVTNTRLTREYKKADLTSRRRSEAGKKGGRPQRVENTQNEQKPGFTFDEAGKSLPEPEPEPEPEEEKREEALASAAIAQRPRGARDPTVEAAAAALTIRERILAACGVGPDGVTGPASFLGTLADMDEVRRWQCDLQLQDEKIIAVISECMRRRKEPPRRFSYFTAAMRDEAARYLAPPLKPAEKNGGYDNAGNSERELRDQNAARYRQTSGLVGVALRRAAKRAERNEGEIQ